MLVSPCPWISPRVYLHCAPPLLNHFYSSYPCSPSQLGQVPWDLSLPEPPHDLLLQQWRNLITCVPLYRPQHSRLIVMLQQWGCFFCISVQPFTEGLGAIVRTASQGFTSDIVDSRSLGRVPGKIVDAARGGVLCEIDD